MSQTGKTDNFLKVSLICRACGLSLVRVLRNLDELPECSNCRSEMLVENVNVEKEN